MTERFHAQNYWYERGVRCYKKKEYEIAIKCFNRSLEFCNSNGFDAWYMKGNSLYQLNEFKEAIKCFDKSLS